MNSSLDLLIVTARIHFRTAEAGGRIGPVKTGYRPNHVFEAQQDVRRLQTYIGEIRFADVPLIYPGETHLVTVAFLQHPVIEKYIQVGRKWWIYEVPKLIAEGEILALEDKQTIR
jgi:hypothetical protein